MEVPMRPLLIRKSPADSPSAPDSRISVAAGRPRLGLSAGRPSEYRRLAVDRHAQSARADKHLPISQCRRQRHVSYRELAGLTDRFGNALTSLGVVKGDCVSCCATASARFMSLCSAR